MNTAGGLFYAFWAWKWLRCRGCFNQVSPGLWVDGFDHIWCNGDGEAQLCLNVIPDLTSKLQSTPPKQFLLFVRAQQLEGGGWRLNGTKVKSSKALRTTFAPQAWIANSWQASGGTVFATTDRGLKHRVEHLSTFTLWWQVLKSGNQLILRAVPINRAQSGSEGDETWDPVHFHCQRHLWGGFKPFQRRCCAVLRMLTIPTFWYFQDVDIPQGNLLGKEGEGFKIAMEILDAGRIPVAAQVSSLASKIKLSLSQQPIWYIRIYSLIDLAS